MKKTVIAIGAVLSPVIAFFLVDFLLNAYRSQVLPKNFSVVRINVLYRSGQLSTDHFAKIVALNGIKTVIALDTANDKKELAIAKQLGINFESFEMPGTGLGDAEAFHRFLEIVGEPANRPVLVHCAAGAKRTGAAVALYRMVFDGWTLDDAVKEMKYSGFDGSPELIEHVAKAYESIPDDLFRRLTRSETPATIR
jgi:tyrosine-protein phosphatase SIW14